MSSRPLRICLVATELKGFGGYGGFGVLTHDIAMGLAARGLDVFVVMPQKEGQSPVERVGNVTILSYSFPASDEFNLLYAGLKLLRPYTGVYRMVDADIYHSQEPSLGTALAQMAAPHRKHLVTFQDPRNLYDWTVEWAHRRLSRQAILKWYLRYQWETGAAARRADARFCQAKFIIEKSRQMYRLRESPVFLPNPIAMPASSPPKAPVPTVCYIGRWDERKRPELFLELAAKFPAVKFIAVGACPNNLARDKALRERCRSLENVEAPGWLAENERAAVLNKAWILINTSTRECLPVTYLEASTHKCAILSHCNADDFASDFGFWAQTGDLGDYEHGLKFLLDGDRWRSLGEKAHDYIRKTHEFNKAIDQHVDVYQKALAR